MRCFLLILSLSLLPAGALNVAYADDIALESELSRPLRSDCPNTECWDLQLELLSQRSANPAQLKCLGELESAFSDLKGISGWSALRARLNTKKIVLKVLDNRERYVKDGAILYGARREARSGNIEVRARLTTRFGCDYLSPETLYFQLDHLTQSQIGTVSEVGTEGERALKVTPATDEALESLNLPHSLSAFF